MACILKPECNFLNGYFRYLLPLDTVDIEVKVKMMRGIHMFRRDRITQVILCNSWSARLCSYPSLIQKVKTYLESEGKHGPKPRPQPQSQLQPSSSTPPQDNIPLTRRALGPKMSEKNRKTRVPTKGKYKVRVIAQPIPTTPMPLAPVNSTWTVPTPSVATTSTQIPMVKSVATSIPLRVYNLVKGNFDGVPYPPGRPQAKKNPSIHHSSPPQLEAAPNAPTFQTPPGLTPYQSPQIYLKPGQTGQFPLCKHPV